MKKQANEIGDIAVKHRMRVVLSKLRKLFPHTKAFLNFSNEWELLVAVELSAQCTDKKVNEITARLFKKYPTLDDYVNADPREFEKDIFQSGFYRNKTKNILAAAKMIKHTYGGKVPNTMDEILKVPGVARKTANVVLGNAYGVVEGIAVDTHVKRLARVFGLTQETDPKRIEKILMKATPKKNWFELTHLFIEYGRAYCPARVHDKTKCPCGHFEW